MDLVATMRVSPRCVGLAAQQIGVAAEVAGAHAIFTRRTYLDQRG